MRIEILTPAGDVINTIIAEEWTVEAMYPGAWRVADHQPDPRPTQPAAPQVCTPAQGLVALFVIKGITESDLLAAIEAIPDPAVRYTAQIGFSRATEWRRTSATMQQMSALLGLSDSELDELFTYAATVQV